MPLNVWDNSTGRHLCVIDDDVVTCVASGKIIAVVRNSTLFAPDGKMICYLQQLPLAYGATDPVAKALKNLLAADRL